MVDDHQLDGRGPVVVRDPLAVDQLPDELGVHRAHGHVARRDRGDRPREAPAVAVEHRQRPQVGRVVAQAGHDHLVQRVQVRAAVGVLHPLGPPGGPGGVVDRDRLFLMLQPARRPHRRRAGQELLVRVPGHAGVVTADHGHPGQVGRLGDRREPGVEQQVLRAAVLQDVPDLGAGQAVVDRDEDPARRGHAEMGLQHGRRVEQQRGDAFSLGQARRPERVGEPPRPFGQFPVAVPPLAGRDGDLVRVQVRGPVQEIDRVQFRTEHGARRRSGSGPAWALGKRVAHHLPPSRPYVTAPAARARLQGS